MIRDTIHWIAGIGADVDDDDIRLRKPLLATCAVPSVMAGTAWGILYIAFGEALSGMIPLSHSCVL